MMDTIDTFTKKQQDGPVGPEFISSSEHLKGVLKEFLEPLKLDAQSLEQVVISALPKEPNVVHDPSNYTIVEGPDGEKYYTDHKGLFINVKDVDTEKQKAVLMLPEEAVEIVMMEAETAKESGAFAVWNEDKDKLIVTFKVPEGFSVSNIKKKFIFDHFTLLDTDQFTLTEVSTVGSSLQDIPTCKFYTAKQSLPEFIPSPEYKFDRPSKFRGSCSNEFVVKNSTDVNPSCPYDMNDKATVLCPVFEQSQWEDVFTGDSLEGKEIITQSRRYGLGHLNWRAINHETSEIVWTAENPGNNLESLLDSLTGFVNELTPVENSPEDPTPQDKVYTYHVANI